MEITRKTWLEILPLTLIFVHFDDAREPVCDGDVWA